MASSKETYCLCGQPYNIGQFMIECDCCREWFHGSCVNVKVYQSDDIDKYHCPKCVQTYGPSVFKIPTNSHRADRYEIGAEARPPQAGTPAWVRSLAETPLRPTSAALQRLRPQQFTEEFVRDNGFTRPIIFHTSDDLDMKIPNSATFTVRSVLRYCGAQHEVEVIDVRKQASIRMPLSEFVDYFETPPEHRDNKVLNVLSLEFSDTNLSPLVEPPGALAALDWARSVWEGAAPRPAVQKYCLMSAAGAYTDFHVDFGGTTVWYHVMHGRKIFYLVPPTSTNLALYQQWSSSPTQSEQFFGDLVEWYGTAELCAGQTLFIPSGWIHAVLTPRDSLVFGGNLLHSYAIEMQLQVYEIERRVETPLMFRYPLFEAMNWYAGVHLLSMLRRYNEEIQDEEFTISESYASSTPAVIPPLLLRGIKILANALKEWHGLKTSDPVKRDNVPKCLNSGQLVRELCKELRTLEKRTTSNNKDKDYKVKSSGSPNKSKKQSTPAKKSLKLTLPKPIMQIGGQNGEFVEEKPYAEKFYIDDKEVQYNDRYVPQDIKYLDNKYIIDNTGKYIETTHIDGNGKYIIDPPKIVDSNGKYIIDNTSKIVENNGKYQYDNGKYIVQDKIIDNTKFIVDSNTKYVVDNKYVIENKDLVYQTYDEVPYQENYVDKKTSVLKLKLNTPSSSQDPPPYPLPSHSILKSQLSRARPAQQWTISKKEGDFTEQLLYTNEHNRTDDPAYGPGMYSAEDIQQDYQYSETAKPGSYQPEYGYPATIAYPYRYDDVPPQNITHQSTAYSSVIQETGVINGGYNQLPSYDAAVAHHYPPAPPAPPAPPDTTPAPHDTTPHFAVEQKAAGAEAEAGAGGGVRRSARSARRRVSSSYDYEDCDLYIDTEPRPNKRKHKHTPKKHASNNSNSSTFRAAPAAAPAPANGIESLIQASVLADGPADNDDDNGRGERGAESPEEAAAAAVAGMLSIGGSVPHHAAFGLATHHTHHSQHTQHTQHQRKSSTPTSRKRVRKQTYTATEGATSEEEDHEDVIKEVHRDEEYVYPSLEMSSDEDEDWTISRRRRNSRNRTDKSKQDKDESWSPRGRVGRLVPRVRGVPRPTRRECVRAALTHAAARAPHPHPPHAPHPSPAPHAALHTQNAKRQVIATKSRRPPPPVQNTPNNKNIRLKKGMKTAKQRLGKILKIHKMIY